MLLNISPGYSNALPMSWKSTNEILSPTSGSVGGGRRSSNVFATAPDPPTGKPVVKSLGPPSLMPKPRFDCAPPTYNRSGSGTALHVGLVASSVPEHAVELTPIWLPALNAFGFGPHCFSNPTRRLRANTYFRFPNV